MLKNRSELMELIKFGNDIKKIINKWDPLDLLYSSQEDEYETEIKAIRNLIINNKNISKELLAKEIKKIFEYYFLNLYNSKDETEINIATKLIKKSGEYKLDFKVPNYLENENIGSKNIGIYIDLYIKIKEIINEWDPLEIRNISFQNEYSNEIKRIQNEFLKNKTIKNLNEKIKKIFKESYNGLYISSEEKELEIAKKIFESCNSILLE